MMSDHPVFAFIGHPNVGKTSVLATLAECDSAEIDRTPGTTKNTIPYPLKFDEETYIQLVDTPGFEHHQYMREWFEQHYNQHDNPAQAFINEHREQRKYRQDCKIICLIAEGAIVLYVVDDSNPIRQADKNEMRIIGLTGSSRMAVVNAHRENSLTREKWRRELKPNFSIVREFNAYNAWHPERTALLRALREVDDRFRERIDYCLTALQADWHNRLIASAETMTELLRDILQYQLSESISGLSAEEIEKKRRQLEEQYKKTVRHRLSVAEEKIRKLYKHTKWQKKLAEHPVRSTDLFADETVRALGMTPRQLAVATALVGATIGGSIDAAVGGTSFLIGTLMGGTAGALAGYFSTPTLIEVQVPGLMSLVLPSSDKRIQVQAIDNPNFIAVILDWMLLYCHEAMRWSHAREQTAETDDGAAGFIHQLSKHDLAVSAAFIAWVKKGKVGRSFPNPMKNMKDLIGDLLEKIADGKLLPKTKAAQ